MLLCTRLCALRFVLVCALTFVLSDVCSHVLSYVLPYALICVLSFVLVNLDVQMFLKGFVYMRVCSCSFLFYNDLQAILLWHFWHYVGRTLLLTTSCLVPLVFHMLPHLLLSSVHSHICALVCLLSY